jgi:uncharacterized protein YlxW (UPF0749 family)
MLGVFFRTKESHQQYLTDQLDRERSENSDIKNKINKLETELSSYLGNEHESKNKLKELVYQELKFIYLLNFISYNDVL